MISETQFILYVADQQRSAAFYQKILALDPALDVPGMTEFQLAPAVKLGIMPEKGIAKLLGDTLPHLSGGGGIPRCELYLIVNDPEQSLRHALTVGAALLSQCAERDWGDVAGYCADPDGHIIAFAKHKA